MNIKDDLSQWEQHRKATLESDEPDQMEFRIKTRTGEKKWIEKYSVLIRDSKSNVVGIRESYRDVTKRKEQDKKSKNSLV